MRGLLLISCLFLASVAHAQQGVQVVHEVAQSTNTIVQTIAICNNNGVPVVSSVTFNTSSGTLAGFFGVEVYNLAASTNTLNCGFDIMVSSSLTPYSGGGINPWYGREVAAGVGVLWQVPSYRILYCKTQNNLGCTFATITQVK